MVVFISVRVCSKNIKKFFISLIFKCNAISDLQFNPIENTFNYLADSKLLKWLVACRSHEKTSLWHFSTNFLIIKTIITALK